MKITIEHTDRMSRSDHGVGRVWTGTTDAGTPIKVLISGMRPDSEDEVLIAQFEREYEAIDGDAPTHCPDCGEPLVEHEVEVKSEVSLDMYEVIARWIDAYGQHPDAARRPPGVSLERMARHMRANLEEADKPYHDALVAAARAVSMYVIEQIMEGQGATRLDSIGAVAGHA